MEYSRRDYLRQSSVAAVTGFAGVSLFSKQGAGDDEELTSVLDGRVPTLLDRYDVPGASIALIEDGEVTWSGAYGTADITEDRPTNEDTPFQVQSITKSVTAWGVLRLVERDEIGLDDPIASHITSWDPPDADYSWEKVTVRRVLSHSAGLPAGGYETVPLDEEPPPLREALSGNVDGPAARPTDKPGEFRYSNPGYALLELLIEDVTGRDYAVYMHEEVLSALEMEGATFDVTDQLHSELATEHLVDGTPVPLSHGPTKAHSGLYATAEDIARFVAAGTETSAEPPERGLLAPESIAELYSPTVETTGFYGLATDGAGLGFFTETHANGKRAVMNGGQGAGSWNWFHAVPETGDGIVILTNSERSVQLIADVVETWVEHSGSPPASLARARRWVRMPIWILVGIAVGLALRLGYGGITGQRSFAPLSERDRTVRIALAGLGLATLGLWWTLGRDTVAFFLPVIAEWVGLALSIVVVLLLVTVLFPRTNRGKRRDC